MKHQIELINLKQQYLQIKDEIDAAIATTLEQTDFIGGQAVANFETEFARFLGKGEVISCGNGTDSLEMILTALDIGPGDEVIVPAMTWISTSEVIVTRGATPVFTDVYFKDACIDISDLRKKITPQTKAIIAVHLHGHPADVVALKAICLEKKIHLIEDCAQAHGTIVKGNKIGTWGIASSFSFFPSKNLGCYGDGGGIYTENKDLAEKIRLIARHGQKARHHHVLNGRNSRLDALQARILSVKLPHLEDWIETKDRHANFYLSELSSIDEITLPPSSGLHSKNSWHLFVIRLKKRDALMEFLKSHGIQTGIHYPKALPFQPCYAHLNLLPEDYPIAHQLQEEILSLPMYPELTKEHLRYIVQTITQFFNS